MADAGDRCFLGRSGYSVARQAPRAGDVRLGSVAVDIEADVLAGQESAQNGGSPEGFGLSVAIDLERAGDQVDPDDACGFGRRARDADERVDDEKECRDSHRTGEERGPAHPLLVPDAGG